MNGANWSEVICSNVIFTESATADDIKI